MHNAPSARDEGGWSFVELIAAVAIVGVALLVMLQQMSISYRETGTSHDNVFAYQKAIAIMAEIQSGVERGTLGDATLLEALDDHDTDNPVLTTLLVDGNPVEPAHTMSGNLQRDGDWIWWRTIEVKGVPSSELMRYVRIRVRAQLRSGVRVTAASIGSVIHLPVQATPAKQVYDVYALAIAGAPSTAMTIESARTAMTSAISRIEAANPGLEYRVHWITKFGYGRNQRYAPMSNAKYAADVVAPAAYWYPGIVAGGGRLFTPDYFSGRYWTDHGVEVNGYDSADNPMPHAIADRFNHCSRTPVAHRTHAARVALGSESIGEPPLQVLLEDLMAAPNKYGNALFVNLHGEALPCPPIRNYSDAAKAPTILPGVRVVTHPERLWTPRDPNGDGNHVDSGDAVFRVYGYKTDPGAGAAILAQPITLQILGVDLTGNVNGANPTSPTSLAVECLAGGVDRGGALTGDLAYYPFAAAKHVGGSPAPQEMHYEVGFVASPVPYTWIKLHNTPLTAPAVGMRGLDASARLYGLEFIPSPITDSGTFDVDLATIDSTARPRNTARWRVTVPKAAFESGFPGGSWVDVDTMLDVVTRIGDDLTTGKMWPTEHQPSNVSETFTWWTRSREAVPITERYQFLGDPRHYPYADGVAGGDGFAHGYNWCFDDLRTGSGSADPLDWTCLDFTRLSDGGLAGNVVDEPRLLQVWRRALETSGAVFQHGAGLLAGSTVIGAEISAPAAPGELDPGTVELSGAWFGTTGTVEHDALVVDPIAIPAPGPETTPTTEKRGRTLVVDTIGKFWSKPWLGELAPDDASEWFSGGNLSMTRFRHALRDEAVLYDLPTGTEFDFASGSRAGPLGAAAFLHANEATGGPLVYALANPGTASTLEGHALDLLRDAGAHPDALVGWRWPFELGAAFTPPAYWSYVSSYPAHYLTELDRLATVGDDNGGIVASLASSGNDVGIVSLTGATPTSTAEHELVLERSLLLGLHAFYVAGEPAHALPVEPPPLCSIVEPESQAEFEEPTAIPVRWRTKFARFDGDPYTPNYTSEYAGNELPLGYVVLISADEGDTWTYAVDGSPAEPGTWIPESSTYLQADVGTGDESYMLATPAKTYADGEYLLRVECYHTERELHYGYHEREIRIRRKAAGLEDD